MRISKGPQIYLRLLIAGLIVLFSALTIVACAQNPPQDDVRVTKKVKKVKKAKAARKVEQTEPDQVAVGDKNAGVSPFVDNLKVGQDGDTAVATYDLVGQNGEQEADVTVAIIIDGQRRTAETLHLTGDFGKRVKIGQGKKIIWNALTDLPSNFDGELSWDVTAASAQPLSQTEKKKVKKAKKKAKKAEPVSE